jgi:hypothetical protein
LQLTHDVELKDTAMKKLLLLVLAVFTCHHTFAQLEKTSDYPTGYVTGFYSTIAPFKDIDGVLYSVYKYDPSGRVIDDYWTLVKYPASRTAETFTVDPRCQRIAKGAFEGARFLKTIIIPNSVSYIGEDAFNGCSSLENIYYGTGHSGVNETESDAGPGDGGDVREVARYNLQGIRCAPSDKGVQIVVYSDSSTKTVIVE